MKLKIIAFDHHRNGVCGAPFAVVLFKDKGPLGGRKVAVLFEEPYHCAVLDVAKLAAGDIAFGSNSWRGDQYEPHLRIAVEKRALADPPKAAEALKPPATKPAIAVVSIRSGLVEEIRTNHPLHVLVEDWDATEVRPSHDEIIPERMLPGEEADLTHFFQPATDQGE
jgi:hypothetical protein